MRHPTPTCGRLSTYRHCWQGARSFLLMLALVLILILVLVLILILIGCSYLSIDIERVSLDSKTRILRGVPALRYLYGENLRLILLFWKFHCLFDSMLLTFEHILLVGWHWKDFALKKQFRLFCGDFLLHFPIDSHIHSNDSVDSLSRNYSENF